MVSDSSHYFLPFYRNFNQQKNTSTLLNLNSQIHSSSILKEIETFCLNTRFTDGNIDSFEQNQFNRTTLTPPQKEKTVMEIRKLFFSSDIFSNCTNNVHVLPTCSYHYAQWILQQGPDNYRIWRALLGDKLKFILLFGRHHVVWSWLFCPWMTGIGKFNDTLTMIDCEKLGYN